MLSKDLRFLVRALCAISVVPGAGAADITMGHLYIQGSSSWVQESFSQFKLGIHDVNNDTSVLPNDRLKFVLHNSQGSKNKALEGAISLVGQGVVGIVGTGYSSAISFAGGYASLSKVPMISPGSTATTLIDKSSFPYVMRSIANDGGQLKALVALAGLFAWTRIAVLVSVDFEAGALQVLRPAMEAEGMRYLILPYKKLIDGQQKTIPDHVDALEGTTRLIKSSGHKVLFGYLRGVDVPTLMSVAAKAGMSWDSESYVWVITSSSGWGQGGKKKMNVLAVTSSEATTSRRKWFDARWKSVTTIYNESIHGKYNATTGLPFYGSAAQSSTVYDTDYAPVGDGKPDAWGSYVYDTVWLYARAMHSLRLQGIDVHDGAKLRQELLKTRFEGITGEIFFDQNSQDRMQPLKLWKGNPDGAEIELGDATQDLANWDLSGPCGANCTTVKASHVKWSKGVGATPSDGRSLDMGKSSIVYSDIVYNEGAPLEITILARSSFQEPPCVEQCTANMSESVCKQYNIQLELCTCSHCKAHEYGGVSFTFSNLATNASVLPVLAPIQTADVKTGKITINFPKGFQGAGTQGRTLRMSVTYKGEVFPGVRMLKLFPQGICQPGQFGPKGKCSPCTPGTFSEMPGLKACKACEAGRAASEFGSTGCAKCALGTYAPGPATATGSSRRMGAYLSASNATKGASKCTRCPFGKYSDVGEASSCIQCAKGATKLVGSTSASDCICPIGQYATANGGCDYCKDGMECPAGSDVANYKYQLNKSMSTSTLSDAYPYPTLKARFWSDPAKPLSVFACESEDRCPGGDPGTCGPNLEERSCAHCGHGFTWNGEECMECSSVETSKVLFPVLPVLLGPLIVIIMYKKFADGIAKWGSWQNGCAAAIAVALNHYQVINLLRGGKIELPTSTKSTLDTWQFTNDILTLFKVACTGFTGFSQNFVVKALGPVVIGAICLLTYGGSMVVAQFRSELKMDKYRLFNVFGSVIYTFFVAIAAMSMSLFKCTQNPNDKKTLADDLSVLCYEGDEWNSMLAVAIVSIFIYVICCGGLFVYIVVVATWKFQSTAFQMSWKFLFIKYRPDVWWWGLVFLAKNILLNLGFVIFPAAVAQFFWIFSVIMVYTALCVVYLPYRHRAVNGLELLSSVSLLYASSVLVAMSFHQNDGKEVNTLSMIIAVGSYFPLAFGVILLAHMRYTGGQTASTKGVDKMADHLTEIIGGARAILNMEPSKQFDFFCHVSQWDRWHVKEMHSFIVGELSQLDASGSSGKRRLASKSFVEDLSRHSDSAFRASFNAMPDKNQVYLPQVTQEVCKDVPLEEQGELVTLKDKVSSLEKQLAVYDGNVASDNFNVPGEGSEFTIPRPSPRLVMVSTPRMEPPATPKPKTPSMSPREERRAQ